MRNGGSDCTAEDFKIKGLRGSDEDSNYAMITGTIVNNCREGAGVQVKVTLFGKNGEVVNTEDEWPASVSNIPAHVPYPFKATIESYGGWSKYSVTPIDARRW
jgi:hypothetical protein